MISSAPSHDADLQVNNAYANIRLIADKTWAYDTADPYRILNRSLWFQNVEWNEFNQRNNGIRRRVNDVIPSSRLAQYGNYEYNEEREKMYKYVDISAGKLWWVDSRETRQQPRLDPRVTWTEPWMLRQVEEHFVRLTSPNLTFWPSTSSTTTSPSTSTKGNAIYGFIAKNDSENSDTIIDKTRKKDECGECSSTIPCTIENENEAQLENRICRKSVKDLWNQGQGNSSLNRVSEGFRASQLFQRQPRDENKFRKLRDESEMQKKDTNTMNYQQVSSNTLTDQTLILKRHQALDGETASAGRPVIPVLSVEVPEFFPKKSKTSDNDSQVTSGPIQYFPSSSERSYQDELFPYNRGHLTNATVMFQNAGSLPILAHPATVNTLIPASHHWIQRIAPHPPIHIQIPRICSVPPPTICAAIQPTYPTIIHRPINVPERIFTPGQANPAPIPVYQRPVELYQDSSQRRGKTNQGVDFKNLILLTKSAMKARRHQSKNPQQTSSFILESRQPNLKSERDVLQWLDKGYPKRAREFVTVNSLVTELNNFEGKCNQEGSNDTAEMPMINEAPVVEVAEADSCENTGLQVPYVPIAKKRLYRDVLTNTASTDIIFESLTDKRYDELEQQAMEQYKTSEECLALRYQELERQALEQYKNGESSVSSSDSVLARHSSLMNNRKNFEDEISDGDDKEFGECGPRCSEHVQHRKNTTKDSFGFVKEEDTPIERKIRILRPENKCESSSSIVVRKSNRCNYDVRDSALITKSLTALKNMSFDGNPKNPIKGASGNERDDQVKSSLNSRHLIAMSPLNEKTDVKTINDADHVSAYYENPTKNRVLSSGDGDDKVTILPTRGRHLWLSSFWG